MRVKTARFVTLPVKLGFVGVLAHPSLPLRGKRSAVAVVNDSPADCQSRDGVARRQLPPQGAEG